MKRKRGGEERQKQLKSQLSACRGLKHVRLLSQSGNGWNCVCCTAYKSQCRQYFSVSDNPAGRWERWNENQQPAPPPTPSPPALPTPTIFSKATCEEKPINIKQAESSLPLPSASRHNCWRYFNVFCPNLKRTWLSHLTPCDDMIRWSMSTPCPQPLH